MDFLSIDVETANADMASICQIGIASVNNGVISERWSSYIDPGDYFDGINISIHGIDETTVKGAPTFDQTIESLYEILDGNIVICHTHFDRIAIQRAAQSHNLRPPEATWLDSSRVARRAWTEVASKGYGLKPLCQKLNYEFQHHDALEDAKAAAHIMIAAMNETGLSLDEWLKRVKGPVDPSMSSQGSAICRDGSPDGPLYGDVVVFTGQLEIPRREAADLAASLGCTVGSSVNKKTTLLVVGDQDIEKLAGHVKSSKHRKAEELISKGQSIRILKESDFSQLV